MTINQQVLDEMREVKESVKTLVCCIVGTTDNPDKPGVMERLRLLEEWKRIATRAVIWVGTIIVGAITLDIISRFLAWYTRDGAGVIETMAR